MQQGGGGYLGQAGAGQAAASAQQYVLQQQLLGALTPQQSVALLAKVRPLVCFCTSQCMRPSTCPEVLVSICSCT